MCGFGENRFKRFKGRLETSKRSLLSGKKGVSQHSTTARLGTQKRLFRVRYDGGIGEVTDGSM